MLDFWLVLATVAIVCLILVWLAARSQRLHNLRARAKERMSLDSCEGQRLVQIVSRLTGDRLTEVELGTYATVTAAEFVWSWASIDPSVVEAADFSSTADIHSVLDFAQYVHSHFDVLGQAAKEGFVNRLIGYVGEQQVADILARQGHVVQLAETSNQAVWDLLIDGHPANVKTVADIALIKAEAAAHPDVTYIVPEDVHGHAGGNIVRLADFKHEATKESVKSSLAAAHGDGAMHGLLHHIPWVTIAFAAYRNIKAVQRGKDPVLAVEHGIAEVICRGGGILVGAKVGAVIGTVFGPVGSFLGALAGGVCGALAGSAMAESYKEQPLRQALCRLQVALHDFGYSFKPKVDTIREWLYTPLRRTEEHFQRVQAYVDERKRTLRWMIWPDFYTVVLEEAVAYGRRKIDEERARIGRVGRILSEAQVTGRYEKVGLLMANSLPVCQKVGYSADLLERVRAAQQAVFWHRKQLDPGFQPPFESESTTAVEGSLPPKC